MGKVVVAALVLSSLFAVQGHPQCLDFKPPFRPNNRFEFCQEYQSLSCCNATAVVSIKIKYSNVIIGLTEKESNDCGDFIRDMLCQVCSPYAAHLFDTEDLETPTKAIPGLCTEYCHRVFKCRHLITQFAQNAESLARIPDVDRFCQEASTSDPDYCYPDYLTNPDLTNSIGTVKFYQRNSSCVKMCVKEVANNLYSPISMKHANDGSLRSFVVEQRGVVWVFFNDWSKLSVPFLDIKDQVLADEIEYDERGLLDIEFSPEYEANGLFYVYYSTLKGNKDFIRISEMQVSFNDMNRADHTYERVLLEIYEPEMNHNGGQLLFGDDGYLYIFVGDGGGAGDRYGKYGNGQNTSSLLGKVLRIDVGNREFHPYAIPPSNPFVFDPSFRSEIYAYGVRNMWRCSKDRGSPSGFGKGRIFCGEVGQNKYEEVDIIEKGGNYGWRAFEAFACYDKKMCKNNKFLKNLVKPIFAYSHKVGKSITGGYVYRGCENPNWKGFYFMGDFMNGRMIMLRQGLKRWHKYALCLANGDICKNDGLQSFYKKYIQSFGEDEAGELYFLSGTLPSSTFRSGSVYKLVDPSLRGNPTECAKEITRQTDIAEGTERTLYQKEVEQHNIRLADGKHKATGRIEVLYNGQWGNICSRGWTTVNSNIVCRNLGYSAANKTDHVAPRGRVWLTDVDCNVDDVSIDDCRKSVWGATARCESVVAITCDIAFFNDEY